jgi:hypothetical protein
MTTVRTVAAYEVVQATYPRPPSEKDEVGRAVGKAIDEALARYSYEFSQRRRPTRSAMERLAAGVFDEQMAESDVVLTATEREAELATVAGVLTAFRSSEVMGLTRPRSRCILINDRVGVYAQPDYWDGQVRLYEMKSYRATPEYPDVRLQLELFQLAFPRFRVYLASFDRHASPVTTTILLQPPLTHPTALGALRRAYDVGLEQGTEKVLEYIDNPIVRYVLPSEAVPPSDTGTSAHS